MSKSKKRVKEIKFSKQRNKKLKSTRYAFKEFRRVIDHLLPDLIPLIRKEIDDPRRKKSCIYPIESIILTCIAMYLTKSKSRNNFNNDGDKENWDINFSKIFNIDMPHMDTVNRVMEIIDEEMLERLKVRLFKVLLSKRFFDRFKKFGRFVIAIDGTGVFSFDEEPYDDCPHKTSKNKITTYHQSVAEAKLVCCNGFSISIASEFLTNADGEIKQDCEYKAVMRLLDKIKKYFPRLSITIVLDGLYVKEPIMNKIKRYDWEFYIVWKDKTSYAMQDTVQLMRSQNKISQFRKDLCSNSTKRIEYNYEYSEQEIKKINKKDETSSLTYNLYYLSVVEEHIEVLDDNTIKKTVHNWKFISSYKPTKQTIEDHTASGRLRWKIENEGFNTQKNLGYKLEHKMNRNNLTAIKNYYQSLQIAHMLDQLIVLCKNTKLLQHWGSVIKFWEFFASEIRLLTDIELQKVQKINLRY